MTNRLGAGGWGRVAGGGACAATVIVGLAVACSAPGAVVQPDTSTKLDASTCSTPPCPSCEACCVNDGPCDPGSTCDVSFPTSGGISCVCSDGKFSCITSQCVGAAQCGGSENGYSCSAGQCGFIGVACPSTTPSQGTVCTDPMPGLCIYPATSDAGPSVCTCAVTGCAGLAPCCATLPTSADVAQCMATLSAGNETACSMAIAAFGGCNSYKGSWSCSGAPDAGPACSPSCCNVGSACTVDSDCCTNLCCAGICANAGGCAGG